MKMRNTVSAVYLIMIVCLSCALGGCEGTPQPGSTLSPHSTPTPTILASTSTVVPTPAPVPTSTPMPEVGLQASKDLVFNNPLYFSSASGTGVVNGVTTQLSADTVEQGVTQNLQQTLFGVDGNRNVSVYTDGSTTPIQAQVSQNADGSTNIQYTHTTRSGSTTFNGTLAGDQMKATYAGESLAGATVNGQTFGGGTDSTSTFTTQVTWVSPDLIPATPTNAHYQLTSDGGVALSWSPGNSATVKEYNIYRFVLTDIRGFQSIGNTATNSYTDESAAARSNAQTVAGIAYDIYAVGPTGIRNPIPAVVSISSLG